jgi:hypothetical protein
LGGSISTVGQANTNAKEGFMSEEALRKFVEQLNTDAKFRERVSKDVVAGLAEFDLSPAEQVALTTNDEDALRRLGGGRIKVSPAEPQVLENWLSRLLCTRWFCGPLRTRDWQCPKHP